jgi:carboxyl-terminal processing protease
VQAATPGPGVVPTATVAPSGPAVLHEAFNQLLDNFVGSLDTASVLQAALEATRSEVERLGGQPPPPNQLQFAGDREANWQLFAAEYAAIASAAPGSAAEDLTQVALRSMAASANDGHTVFLTARDYDEYRTWLSGDLQYAGIGVRLAGSPPTVYEVFPNSPAERAGLQFGDRISATEGRSTDGLTLDEVVNAIRGDPGTLVHLTIRRGEDGQHDLVVPRQQVQVATVESRLLDGGVGYIHVRGFPDPKVTDRVEQALGEFRSQSVTSLVLDLRGNTGGRIDVGTDTLGLFLDDKPAYRQVSHAGEMLVRTPPKRSQLSAGLPIAVLVDRATASMGEVFAAAVQDNHAGRVIGTVTSGNVAGGQIFPLSDGSALQVTVFRLDSALGHSLNRVGVQPDERVDRSAADVRQGRDPQLEAGLAYLGEVLKEPARQAW